jgi:PcfJ-like protein
MFTPQKICTNRKQVISEWLSGPYSDEPRFSLWLTTNFSNYIFNPETAMVPGDWGFQVVPSLLFEDVVRFKSFGIHFAHVVIDTESFNDFDLSLYRQGHSFYHLSFSDSSKLTHVKDALMEAFPSRKDWSRITPKQALDIVKKWDLELKKQKTKGEGETEIVYSLPDLEVDFHKLLDKESYVYEGAKQGHCVASYYGRDCDVYSCRSGDLTLFTFEIKSKTLVQAKGKQNQRLTPADLDYLDKFLNKFEFTKTPSETRFGTLFDREGRQVCTAIRSIETQSLGPRTYAFRGHAHTLNREDRDLVNYNAYREEMYEIHIKILANPEQTHYLAQLAGANRMDISRESTMTRHRQDF